MGTGLIGKTTARATKALMATSRTERTRLLATLWKPVSMRSNQHDPRLGARRATRMAATVRTASMPKSMIWNSVPYKFLWILLGFWNCHQFCTPVLTIAVVTR
jgi:hypothetical protein